MANLDDDDDVPSSEELIAWAEEGQSPQDDRSIGRKIRDYIRLGEIHRYLFLLIIGSMAGTYWGIAFEKTNELNFACL